LCMARLPAGIFVLGPHQLAAFLSPLLPGHRSRSSTQTTVERFATGRSIPASGSRHATRPVANDVPLTRQLPGAGGPFPYEVIR
jgi:hypothetical protein